MKIPAFLGALLFMAGAIVACSAAPRDTSPEETGTSAAAYNTCNPRCTAQYTDCQATSNKGQTITECASCGAQGQAPCDGTGPEAQGTCQSIAHGYLGPVNGVCQQCGQAPGQPACGGVQCSPYDTRFPQLNQPMDVSTAHTCEDCGYVGQPACHQFPGSIAVWCVEGASVFQGTCIEKCVVGQASGGLCGFNHCNDGSCESGVPTSCSNPEMPTCTDGCGSHGGVDHSVGCIQIAN
jgi:hypothetical protein